MEKESFPPVIRSDHLVADVDHAKRWAKLRAKMFSGYKEGSREGGVAFASYEPEEVLNRETGLPETHDRIVAHYATNVNSIANASVFVFGGLYHDSLESLGQPLMKIMELWNPIDAGKPRDLSVEEKATLFGMHTLAFVPYQSTQDDRIDEAYDWNIDKGFPKTADGRKPASTDIEEFADALFRNRFLHKGKLVPPDEFKGFNFITYSIGGRLAFIVENLVREKLHDYMRAHAEQTPKWNHVQTRNKDIQEYFSKCRIACIGHAVDWENSLPQGTPVMPKTFFIGKGDAGICYRDSFLKFIDDHPMPEGTYSAHYDVSDKFNAPANTHDVIILNDGILQAAKGRHSTNDGHGLGDYARAIRGGVGILDENIDKIFIPKMFSSLNRDCKAFWTNRTTQPRPSRPRPMLRPPIIGKEAPHIHQPDLPFGAGVDMDGNGNKSTPSRG